MHVLRNSSVIARLVLTWFALTLGVAVASPIVNPHSMELVCSSGGHIKLVELDDEGQLVTDHSFSLDCSLCLPLLATPPVEVGVLNVSISPEQVAPTFMQEIIPSRTGAPLPARGPPTRV